MAIINQATKELQVKIVYYGPALGGKTTNLVQVHEHVQTAQGSKGKLVSLATNSDRTLFFDFLPIEAMAIKGFKTKFQLYTVPGQVFYSATRKLVLKGADAVIFAVRHKPYLNLEPEALVRMTGGPVAVIDCFGILDDRKIEKYFELGCEVKGLGRGHIQRIKDKVRKTKRNREV